MTVRREIAYLNERVCEAHLVKREAQDKKNVCLILFARYEIRFTSDAWNLQ
jgi:hypothetical protein